MKQLWDLFFVEKITIKSFHHVLDSTRERPALLKTKEVLERDIEVIYFHLTIKYTEYNEAILDSSNSFLGQVYIIYIYV